MKPKIKKKGEETCAAVCGLFSKKEAAKLISNGAKHLHSSTLGARDRFAKVTQDSLESRVTPTYPWETIDSKSTYRIVASAQRYNLIREVLAQKAVSARRNLRERVEMVMEELLSNAIYHAYRNEDGSERYVRKQSVTLMEQETIELSFASSNEGVFLSVSDQGGTLIFGDLARSFTRCYAEDGNQIEHKPGGAGLGLYMTFEAVTHLKIVTEPNRKTIVNCWIAAPNSFDPGVFSFNFFDRR